MIPFLCIEWHSWISKDNHCAFRAGSTPIRWHWPFIVPTSLSLRHDHHNAPPRLTPAELVPSLCVEQHNRPCHASGTTSNFAAPPPPPPAPAPAPASPRRNAARADPRHPTLDLTLTNTMPECRHIHVCAHKSEHTQHRCSGLCSIHARTAGSRTDSKDTGTRAAGRKRDFGQAASARCVSTGRQEARARAGS